MFFFLSDSWIASHSPFAYNWQNRFSDGKPVLARFLSNKGGNSDIRIAHDLCGVAPRPMYACCVLCAWVGLEPYIETNVVSYSFDSINEAQESKEGHL